MAMATITQGDFSVFGGGTTEWSGRWGEGSANGGELADPHVVGQDIIPDSVAAEGVAPSRTGGSFDFNHWDLVQARQIADIRPDYHFVKNYNLLGRIDTMVLKDADFFAIYRGWYDAEGDIKHEGVAPTARDWTSFTDREKQAEFIRDDLREYYGQLNFTDNFSMRVGKQQVIWSEADALSGTNVTNPSDYRYHWNHFEAPEDLRENLRMVKFNYILPDFLKTANNEFEAFWIPGDYENPALIVNTTDARAPYAAFSALNPSVLWNENGQPFSEENFSQYGQYPMTASPTASGYFQGPDVVETQNKLSNSIDNSEFGFRYSSLLPIGNGLQSSLIFLYEARQPKLGYCQNCPPPSNWAKSFQQYVESTEPHILPPGGYFVDGPVWPVNSGPGVPRATDAFAPGVPPLSIEVFTHQENVRQPYFEWTGTYYDKELTDIVYRYDLEYAPKIGINTYDQQWKPRIYNQIPTTLYDPYLSGSSAKWTEFTRFIFAGDRPTYIPWLSKQHTFLTFQNTVSWYPDRPNNAVPNFGSDVGKVREISTFSFLSAVNWLMNGQWTATNVAEWDWDDNVGALSSTNAYRYSRNILLGLDAIWYLGRSARYTDPYALSRAQNDNEIEFRLTYEI